MGEGKKKEDWARLNLYQSNNKIKKLSDKAERSKILLSSFAVTAHVSTYMRKFIMFFHLILAHPFEIANMPMLQMRKLRLKD